MTRLKKLVQWKDNSKFWRSQVMVLAQDIDLPLLTFCKHITKDGLFLIGSAMVPTQPDGVQDAPSRRRSLTQNMLPAFSHREAVAKATWMWVIDTFKLGAMVTVAKGASLLQTLTTMISCAGMGGLTPNTVVIPYKDSVLPVKVSFGTLIVLACSFYCYLQSTRADSAVACAHAGRGLRRAYQ